MDKNNFQKSPEEQIHEAVKKVSFEINKKEDLKYISDNVAYNRIKNKKKLALESSPNWWDKSEFCFYDDSKTKLEQLTDSELHNITQAFINRNPKYIADFKIKHQSKNFIENIGLESFENKIESGEISLYPHYICEPPALPEETRPQYLKRMFGKKWRILPINIYLSEKYWLSYSNSSISTPIQTAHDERLDGLAPWKIEKISDAFVKFDLSLPIKPQIEHAKNVLEMEQRYLAEKGHVSVYNGKISANLLPFYLQILDAYEAGENYDDIAKSLLPNVDNNYSSGYLGRKRIEAAHKRAIQIRDHGYKYFVLANDSHKHLRIRTKPKKNK